MVSRRDILRGRMQPQQAEPRPPWALSEEAFIERCTACDACIEVCPESILLRGDGGFPRISFSRAGCTFCGDCLAACEPGALNRVDEARREFPFYARINDACVNLEGVVCRSCDDVCEQDALHFSPQIGGRYAVSLDREKCNGCGECLHLCPVKAIGMVRMNSNSLEAAANG